MKPGIHPSYVEANVSCACGNTFTTRSTKQNLRTDLCNVCHPFYTGEQRIIDTAGQVERFMRRMEGAGDPRTSKRQQRLQERATKIELDRKRAEEAARAQQAEEAAARAATRAAAAAAAEAAAAAQAESTSAADEAASASAETATETETETASEAPAVETATESADEA